MIGFVHIPKTAGSTMKFVLRNTFGVAHCDLRPLHRGWTLYEKDVAWVRRVYPWVRSVGGHAFYDPVHRVPSVRPFTILRDPVRRVASAYAQHVRGNRRKRDGLPRLTLEEFLERDPRGGVQIDYVSGGRSLPEARRCLEKSYLMVGLAERFDESLAILSALSPSRIDTRYRSLRRAPAGDPVKAGLLADPGQRRLIEDANRADLELYHWVVEDLYPRQLERAREIGGSRFHCEGESKVGVLRSKCCRGYNLGVFRPLTKLRARWTA